LIVARNSPFTATYYVKVMDISDNTEKRAAREIDSETIRIILFPPGVPRFTG
jgi:hypothetical protein